MVILELNLKCGRSLLVIYESIFSHIFLTLCINLIAIFYIVDIEAECQDDFMKIRVGFNGSFTGLVYSAGEFFRSSDIVWLVEK